MDLDEHRVDHPAPERGRSGQGVLEPCRLGVVLTGAVAELKVRGVQRVEGALVLAKDRCFQEAIKRRDRNRLLSPDRMGLAQTAEGQQGGKGVRPPW